MKSITFGEAMIRLSPPNFRRLEQARSLDVQVGGAELNTAVGLARLGRSAAWVSRLTDNPLGRLIANHAREAGVSHRARRLDDGGPRRPLLPGIRRRPAPAASSTTARARPSPTIRPGMVPWAEVFRRREVVPRHRHHAGPESRPPPRRRARRCRPREAAGVQHQHRPQLSRQAVEPGRGRPVHDRPDAVLRRAHHHRGGHREASSASPARTTRTRPPSCARRFPLRVVGHHPAREPAGVEEQLDGHRLPGRPRPARRGLTRWKSSIDSAPAIRSRRG